jgi:hypothetical protein
MISNTGDPLLPAASVLWKSACFCAGLFFWGKQAIIRLCCRFLTVSQFLIVTDQDECIAQLLDFQESVMCISDSDFKGFIINPRRGEVSFLSKVSGDSQRDRCFVSSSLSPLIIAADVL